MGSKHHYQIGEWSAQVIHQDDHLDVTVSKGDERHSFKIAPKSVREQVWSLRPHISVGEKTDRNTSWAFADMQDEVCEVQIQDTTSTRTLSVSFGSGQHDAKSATARADRQLKAPMPGRVVSISVKPGDDIKPGQPAIVIEAMKMQNELTVKVPSKVKKINVSEGENVERNAVLMELE